MKLFTEPMLRVVSILAGGLALFTGGLTLWLGLAVTPPDAVQGELVRIIYIHPALAWTAFEAFGIAALAGALYLYPRTRRPLWDQLSVAAAEVGVIFCVLTLVTGSIWGRPTWGVWWTWDARLTTTAMLLTLFLGYLALRAIPADPAVRAKRSAIAALVAAADVPLVHFSVEWWRTLHQDRTLLRPDPTIEGSQLATMLLSFVAMTLLFIWLTVQRLRVEQMQQQLDQVSFEAALHARRNEQGNTSNTSNAGTTVDRSEELRKDEAVVVAVDSRSTEVKR